MNAIYLLCMVFGGFFLAVSILAGTESDAELALRAQGSAENAGPSNSRLVSFRTFVFFIAAFGFAGYCAVKFGAGSISSVVVAAVAGLLSLFAGQRVSSGTSVESRPDPG